MIFKVNGQGHIFRRGDTSRFVLPLFYTDCINPNIVVLNHFHSVEEKKKLSTRSPDFDGMFGIELPVSMYTTKTSIDLCRFDVRSSTSTKLRRDIVMLPSVCPLLQMSLMRLNFGPGHAYEEQNIMIKMPEINVCEVSFLIKLYIKTALNNWTNCMDSSKCYLPYVVVQNFAPFCIL